MILTRVTNTSRETWPAQGTTRVNLSYHWLDAEDGQTLAEGRRTPLPMDLQPGAEVEVQQTIRAPEQPGTYVLELDLVRERVSWFSRRQPGQTHQATIDVLPVVATADSPEP